jgi:hypothetical protein
VAPWVSWTGPAQRYVESDATLRRAGRSTQTDKGAIALSGVSTKVVTLHRAWRGKSWRLQGRVCDASFRVRQARSVNEGCRGLFRLPSRAGAADFDPSDATTENRGVPSSSLGLAIEEGPAIGGAFLSSRPGGRGDGDSPTLTASR